MSNHKTEKGIETVTLQIGGMNCSCEGNLIEKKMGSLVGIKNYDINPVSSRSVFLTTRRTLPSRTSSGQYPRQE